MGEQTAMVRAANPKEAATDSRDHPNAVLRGFRKVLKLKTRSEPKLIITPK
jgi:hypothetical protein